MVNGRGIGAGPPAIWIAQIELTVEPTVVALADGGDVVIAVSSRPIVRSKLGVALIAAASVVAGVVMALSGARLWALAISASAFVFGLGVLVARLRRSTRLQRALNDKLFDELRGRIERTFATGVWMLTEVEVAVPTHLDAIARSPERRRRRRRCGPPGPTPRTSFDSD